MRLTAQEHEERGAPGTGLIAPETPTGELDAALVVGLRRRDAAATHDLFHRYGHHIRAVLIRVLGQDRELGDLVQEVFVRALERVGQLKDVRALKPWLSSIAVFTAREAIRTRTRRRWLVFGDTREPSAPPIAEEGREAVRELYTFLTRLPTNERIAFTRRFVEGMELAELAEVSQVSLSTVRRRLTRVNRRLQRLLKIYPALRERMGGCA